MVPAGELLGGSVAAMLSRRWTGTVEPNRSARSDVGLGSRAGGDEPRHLPAAFRDHQRLAVLDAVKVLAEVLP